jgi:drug/metabolite transporter (DMT)-like permease
MTSSSESAATVETPGVRTGLGIACMLAGAFCLSSMDALAKWLGADYSLVQVVFFRSLFALPPVLLLARMTGGLRTLRTRRPGLHLFRGVVMGVSVFAFFQGLRYMPLAEAWAVVFAAPLLITALSPLVLGESVGWRRWLAVLTGFAGVLLIVRPGLGTFQPASLFPLAAAGAYAINFLLSRKYAAEENTAVNVLYISLVPMIGTAVLLPVSWTPAPLGDIGLFVAMGTLGGLAMLFLTQAFRVAPAPVVAPFDYSAMIWAVLWGWVVWRDWPDAWTWAGAALIVGAGLYVGHREALLARRARRTAVH